MIVGQRQTILAWASTMFNILLLPSSDTGYFWNSFFLVPHPLSLVIICETNWIISSLGLTMVMKNSAERPVDKFSSFYVVVLHLSRCSWEAQKNGIWRIFSISIFFLSWTKCERQAWMKLYNLKLLSSTQPTICGKRIEIQCISMICYTVQMSRERDEVLFLKLHRTSHVLHAHIYYNLCLLVMLQWMWTLLSREWKSSSARFYHPNGVIGLWKNRFPHFMFMLINFQSWMRQSFSLFGISGVASL